MRPVVTEKALRVVRLWNELYPVGQPVVVSRDNGDRLRTVTRSQAEVLASGEPVIWVKGIAGCYALDRVTPIEEDEIEGPGPRGEA